jgi:putative FmdB family regulatory protein
MALFEYFCDRCKLKFEQITSSGDPDAGKCPKCKDKDKTNKLISRFAVGGQGDLRESTMHGCHDAHVGLGDGHDHGHDHGDHDSDS